jgi:predicted nucleotidyltransferase
MGLRVGIVWRKEGELGMTTKFQGILEGGEPRVAQLCRDLSVRELRLFGSAATDKFDETRSDVDVVVDFADSDKPGIADRYLALAEGLEEIFHRPVDLVTTRAIRNPFFRQIVEETSQLIYAA